PSTCTASIRQLRLARPSTSTVQAPHTPCSHPTWVPVAPSSCRRKSHNWVRGSAYPLRSRPFRVRVTRMRWSALACMSDLLVTWLTGDQLPAELTDQLAAIGRRGMGVIFCTQRPGKGVEGVSQILMVAYMATYWTVCDAADAA